MPPPLVGGDEKLLQEGKEMGEVMPSAIPVSHLVPMGGDSHEDRALVLLTASTAYTKPHPRKYQEVLSD